MMKLSSKPFRVSRKHNKWIFSYLNISFTTVNIGYLAVEKELVSQLTITFSHN